MTKDDRITFRYLVPTLLVTSFWIFYGTCFAAQGAVSINNITPTQKQLRQIGIKLPPGKRYWYDTTAGLIGFEGRERSWWVTPGLKLGKLRRNASSGTTRVFFNGRELPKRELGLVEREIKKKLKRGRYWLTADGSGGLVGGSRLFRLKTKQAVAATTTLPKTATKKPKVATKSLPKTTAKSMPKIVTPTIPKIETESAPKVAGIQQLPRPIPKWTSRYLLPNSVLFSRDSTETLGNVFDRVEIAMRRAEMYSWSAYAIHEDGFALITQLEAIDDSGAPRAAPNRWAFKSENNGSLSIADYFSSLFKSDPGRYRVILLAISHRDLKTEISDATSEQLQQLLRDGATALPTELRNKLLQEQTRCIAYVYEFERTSNSVTQIDNSGLHVIDHLSAGGYWDRQNLQ